MSKTHKESRRDPDEIPDPGADGGHVRRGVGWIRRHKVVSVIIAALSIAASTTTVIRNYDDALVSVGLRDDPTSVVTRAEAVRECMRIHGLGTAREAIWRTEPKAEGEASDQTRVFRECDWPPSAGADPDGYREIRIRFAIGPNTESQWPIGPRAYRLRSDNCDTFVMLVSRGGGSGHIERQPPVTVRRNEVRTVENNLWRDDPEFTALPFQRQRDEAIVLSNDHYVFDGVTCSK